MTAGRASLSTEILALLPEDGTPVLNRVMRVMLARRLEPGCYELRRGESGKLVLFGVGGHVAKRMSSLLPKPLGTGTRNNAPKRAYCLEHIADLEYRTLPCTTRKDAAEQEKIMKAEAASYEFGTWSQPYTY